MYNFVNEKVSVVTAFDQSNGSVMPRKLEWKGRDYLITKLSYHHKIRIGRAILHIFHVTDGSVDFRLRFDTDTLHWTLEEVSDGTAS